MQPGAVQMIFMPQPIEPSELTHMHVRSGNTSIYVRRYLLGQYRLQLAHWDERYVFNPDVYGPEC